MGVTTAATTKPPVPGPLPKPGHVPPSLRLMAADIKLAHSIFAMPFAILASFLALVGGKGAHVEPAKWWAFLAKLLLVIACMVTARTWAMLINRLVDRKFDAANPRTQQRVFASGKLSPAKGWIVTGICGTLFIGLALLFDVFFHNPWPVGFAVPVLAWVALYSFTKRFTALCHIFLGTSLAVAPLAAALAIDPSALTNTPSIWWLAGFVVMWVAGFDIIYALQDREFDKEKGLKSIPVTLGQEGARMASMTLHAVGAVMLLAAWTSHPSLGPITGSGIVIVLALLTIEHIIVGVGAKRGLAGLNVAFFTLNGVVSCVLGVLGVVDLLL